MNIKTFSAIFVFMFLSSCNSKSSFPFIIVVYLVLIVAAIPYILKNTGKIKSNFKQDFTIKNKSKTGIILITIGVIISTIAITIPFDPTNNYGELITSIMPAYKFPINKLLLCIALFLFFIGGVLLANGVANKSK